ncbi:hypothetical protein [Candidatus Phytoplasma solani]|uniref:hypothetical protein n=1 Tax=Candidatus Phytoplasma solani TaxID=69896 RepID=UPI0032D9BB7C
MICLNLLMFAVIKNKFDSGIMTALGSLLFIHLYYLSFGLFQIIMRMKHVIVLKNKDIGILKSLGASDKDIAKIFYLLNFKLSKIQFLASPVYGLFLLFLVFVYSKLASLYSSYTPQNKTSLNFLKIFYNKSSLIFCLIIINIILFFALVLGYPLFLNYIAIKRQLKKILNNNPLKIISKPEKL